MSPILFRPTTEVVSIEWLRLHAPGAGQDFGVAATLPAATSWPGGAFATVQVIPMAADVDLAQRVQGYLQVDAWAVHDATAGSTLKPSWRKAGQVIAAIREATDERQPFGTDLASLAALGYCTPRVQAAWVEVEEERVDGDPSGYAHFRMDLRLDWVTP